MSRLAKKPINLPEGVSAKKDNNTIIIEGPLGKLSRIFRSEIEINIDGRCINLKGPEKETVMARTLLGTYASHLSNMVEGVTKGYEKKLIIEGVGYKWEIKDKEVILSLGFSHPVKVIIPAGLKVGVEKGTMTVSGADKELVGQFAARVKSLKKVEPYKGKGIHYEGERVRRKQGKKTAK